MAIPHERNQRWSLDLVSDALSDGPRFRVLAIVDDFTRECLTLVADTSLSGHRTPYARWCGRGGAARFPYPDQSPADFVGMRNPAQLMDKGGISLKHPVAVAGRCQILILDPLLEYPREQITKLGFRANASSNAG